MILEDLAPGARRRTHTAGTTEASLLGLLDVENHGLRLLKGRVDVNQSFHVNVLEFSVRVAWLVCVYRLAAQCLFAGHFSRLEGPIFARPLRSHPWLAASRATCLIPDEFAGQDAGGLIRNEIRGTCKPAGRSRAPHWQPTPKPSSRISRPPGSQTYVFGKKKARLPEALKPIAESVGGRFFGSWACEFPTGAALAPAYRSKHFWLPPDCSLRW